MYWTKWKSNKIPKESHVSLHPQHWQGREHWHLYPSHQGALVYNRRNSPDHHRLNMHTPAEPHTSFKIGLPKCSHKFTYRKRREESGTINNDLNIHMQGHWENIFHWYTREIYASHETYIQIYMTNQLPGSHALDSAPLVLHILFTKAFMYCAHHALRQFHVLTPLYLYTLLWHCPKGSLAKLFFADSGSSQRCSKIFFLIKFVSVWYF